MGKVLKVREVGDPILEKECEEVEIKNIDEDILEIIEDLKSTLEFGTGLGISAPQIGINKRIIVVGANKEDIKYNDAEEIPLTAMINPTWKALSEDTDVQYEGCMSVPIIRGKVERYKSIELTYYNENGEKIVKKLNGFFARLVQHECDHLDGIVFLEKVKEKNGFATTDNIKKYNLKEKYSYINDLKKILEQNTDKRVCVIGTSCTGKSTYLKYANNGLDMDDIIFPLLTEQEKEYVCKTPWTEEIGKTIDRLVKERIKIREGQPVFGTVIIDCDLIVYLNISDNLLRKRAENRGVNYSDAKNMKNNIEKDLEKTNIPVITVTVEEK